MEATAIRGDQLDTYLLQGKYRYGNRIDTTNFVGENGGHYPVFWLRYAVERIQLSSKQQKLKRKNSRFSYEYWPFTYTQELHDLYALYRGHIDFTAADALADALGGADNTIFDTWVAEVRDNGRLIAAGIFDRGKEAVSGIINFYDPAYSGYSMGRYLMLLKAHYCSENKYAWYYPGYYSPKCEGSKFNYKLFIDRNAIEVFIPGIEVWLPYHQFTKLIGE